MLPMLPGDFSDCCFVGCNGGIVYKSGKSIFSNALEKEHVTTILDFLGKNKIPYVVDTSWGFALSDEYHDFHDYIRSLSNAEEDLKSINIADITKILILDNKNKKEILRSCVNEFFLSVHDHTSSGFYDITPSGNNKFETVSNVLSVKKYIAFGNDYNDFLLLDNASLSVFVGDQRIYLNANYYTSVNNLPSVMDIICEMI
jgi:hydroxymethylpyrimidine pyrophosphatase-like HAD family hydrolase